MISQPVLQSYVNKLAQIKTKWKHYFMNPSPKDIKLSVHSKELPVGSRKHISFYSKMNGQSCSVKIREAVSGLIITLVWPSKWIKRALRIWVSWEAMHLGRYTICMIVENSQERARIENIGELPWVEWSIKTISWVWMDLENSML